MSRLNNLEKSIDSFSKGKYTVKHRCAVIFLGKMAHSTLTTAKVCHFPCHSCLAYTGNEKNLSGYSARLNLGRLDE